MAKLAYLVTSPYSADKHLTGQLAFMRARGHEVVVICGPGPSTDRVIARERVRVVTVPMAREISPARDLVSLARVFRTLRAERPSIVIAGTPKAGLLGMLAAWLLRVPVRIYLLHGLRSETLRGVRRALVNFTERLASLCAHVVVAVGPSVRARFLQLGLAPASKVIVLGAGTCNGIDIEQFTPGDTSRAEASRLRVAHGLGGEPVIGFVGRITRDKGIADLYQAFNAVSAAIPRVRLLIVGRHEAGDPIDPGLDQALRTDPRVILCGQVDNPAPYYQLMDVCAFPTYREGFPSVPLEAALAGAPTVAFRATGAVDAVISDVTGVLVDIGAADDLAAQLLRLLQAAELRAALAAAGATRVREEFGQARVWQAWLDLFQSLQAHEHQAPV